MKKFTYKTYTPDNDCDYWYQTNYRSETDWLNALGEDGWELTSVIVFQDGSRIKKSYYFKREIV